MLLAISPLTGGQSSVTPFVLVVDDDAGCRECLRQVIELAGHRCVSASSGIDALGRCALATPRLVVTDLAMPGLDGESLALRLREKMPKVPVIVVTGQDENDPRLAALRSFVTAVLAKPIDPARFLRLIADLLSKTDGTMTGTSRT